LSVLFRASSLDDLRRHDAWRATLDPPAPPIRDEIATAIVHKLSGFASFEALPYPTVSVRGEILPVKRCLVEVRSKRFVVFLAVEANGRFAVARIRHPRQSPLGATD